MMISIYHFQIFTYIFHLIIQEQISQIDLNIFAKVSKSFQVLPNEFIFKPDVASLQIFAQVFITLEF